MNRLSPERRQVGLNLHRAETAIYMSRQAIRTLVTEEPIDEIAVAEHRIEMHGARITRNELRDELAEVKWREGNPLAMAVSWTLGSQGA